MSRRLYIVYVWGMIDPSLIGPFATQEAREEKLKEVAQEMGEEDVCFWLDVHDDEVEIGSYSGGYMDIMRGEVEE